MTSHQEPYGLAFTAAVAAEDLEAGTIVVLDGHVVERSADPDDPDKVRLVIRAALGPPPGRDPDRREIVVIAPADMRFGTARPQNIEIAPTG
jgi:hypothetical protein